MSTVTRGFIVFGILVAVVVFACVMPAFFWLPQAGQGVALPVILLPAEVLVPNWPFFGYDFTNTLTMLLVVDAIVIILGLLVWRATSGKRPDEFVPKGMVNFLELITEFLYNQAQSLLGPNTRKVFPVAATIFLMILVANWVKLVPGVEAVGLLVCAEPGFPSYRIDHAQRSDGIPGVFLKNDAGTLGERAGLQPTTTIDDTHACEEKYPELTPPLVIAQKERAKAAGVTTDAEHKEGEATGEPTGEPTQEATKGTPRLIDPAQVGSGTAAEGKGDPERFTVAPFFRGLSTDLNFPLALALFVVIAVQFWGVSALGPAYFFKFINIPALGNIQKKPMGAIDFVVGLIEIVSEVSRIISLTFRLFGNIFAGGILVIVMSFLVAFLLPAPFYILEIFVGAVQAYVFAMLTFIYAGQAMTAHHADDHEGEGHDDHH